MGFYNTARQKSDFLGIRCLDIEEVDPFDWMLARGLPWLTTKLLHHVWIFYPEIEGVADKTSMEVIDTETGATSPVKYVIVTICYSIVEEFIPFKLVQYNEADEMITEAAVAELNTDNMKGKFMFVGKSGEEKGAVFVLDKVKSGAAELDL